MNSNDFSIAFAKASVLAIVRQTAENLVALGIPGGRSTERSSSCVTGCKSLEALSWTLKPIPPDKAAES
jgi:hypothetical protein